MPVLSDSGREAGSGCVSLAKVARPASLASEMSRDSRYRTCAWVPTPESENSLRYKGFLAERATGIEPATSSLGSC
jgi:hypothetical protein